MGLVLRMLFEVRREEREAKVERIKAGKRILWGIDGKIWRG